MEILIFSNEYKSINTSNLLGIFLAASISNNETPIIQKINNSSFKLLEFNDLNFSQEYILTNINSNKNIENYFNLFSMNNIIYKKNGNKITLINFDDLEILEGINIFFSSLNIYPINTTYFKRENNNLKEKYLNINIVNFLENYDYVTPQIINVKYMDKIYEFNSKDINGWKSENLFNSIKSKFNKICSNLTNSGENNYFPSFIPTY
jgi:hypothetical protein